MSEKRDPCKTCGFLHGLMDETIQVWGALRAVGEMLDAKPVPAECVMRTLYESCAQLLIEVGGGMPASCPPPPAGAGTEERCDWDGLGFKCGHPRTAPLHQPPFDDGPKGVTSDNIRFRHAFVPPTPAPAKPLVRTGAEGGRIVDPEMLMKQSGVIATYDAVEAHMNAAKPEAEKPFNNGDSLCDHTPGPVDKIEREQERCIYVALGGMDPCGHPESAPLHRPVREHLGPFAHPFTPAAKPEAEKRNTYEEIKAKYPTTLALEEERVRMESAPSPAPEQSPPGEGGKKWTLHGLAGAVDVCRGLGCTGKQHITVVPAADADRLARELEAERELRLGAEAEREEWRTYGNEQDREVSRLNRHINKQDETIASMRRDYDAGRDALRAQLERGQRPDVGEAVMRCSCRHTGPRHWCGHGPCEKLGCRCKIYDPQPMPEQQGGGKK